MSALFAQLFLLIFIGISTVEHATNADLPSHSPVPAADPERAADAVTTITLRKDEQEALIITIDGKAVSADALPAELQELAQKSPDQMVYLRVQNDIPWKAVQEFIQACTQAGVKNISFSRPISELNS